MTPKIQEHSWPQELSRSISECLDVKEVAAMAMTKSGTAHCNALGSTVGWRPGADDACRGETPCSDEPVGTQEVSVVDYADPNRAILSTEAEVYMDIALDTGAVEHVASAKHLPCNTVVEKTERSETCGFVAADGSPMENYGEAFVTTVGEEGGECNTVWNVTDVTRPLHAACKIADQENEILIMAHKSVVVPAGTFSRYLKQAKVKATYHRRGGLYIGRMRARAAASRRPAPRPPTPARANGKPSGFPRRGR